MYAHPESPEKCPVLAFAILLFSFPNRPNNRQQVFAGSNSKDRFGRLLQRVLLSLNKSELQQLGCSVDDIGTHSIRKGSSTFALGQVSGPTPVSVFLRMGQTLGQLKDRYIHVSEGADQLCGRIVAGLPFDSEKFTVLPPHFSTEIISEMTNDFWKKILDGYCTLPNGIKTALPFLLASVIHHENFLRENLASTHPIFSSRVFTHNPLLKQLRGNTLLNYGNCPHTDLKATGIPPHLAIAARLANVVEETRELKHELENQINGLRKELVDMKATFKHEVAVAVTEELTENFTIEGVAPVSLRSINESIDKRLEKLEESLVSRIGGQMLTQSPQDSLSTANENPWKTWDWGDGHICHFVPKGWKFPTGKTVKALWDLWWYGDRDTQIRPFYKITFSKELKKKSSCAMNVSRAKSVIEYCVALVLELRLLPQGVREIYQLSIENSDKIFNVMFKEHAITRLYAGREEPGRPMEITVGTIYKYIPKPKQKNNNIAMLKLVYVLYLYFRPII